MITIKIASAYAFVFATALSISGCQDILDEDGTTLAYSKCVDRAKTQNLQPNTSKLYCTNKHQKDISIETGGTAEYVYTTEPWFYGNVVNNSRGYIVTSFVIIIVAGDNKTVDSKSFGDMWIEPMDKSSFTFHNNELKSIPDKSAGLSVSWTWRIENVKGIKIKI